ncbi:hypothetical protein [Lonsdalea quercina]
MSSYERTLINQTYPKVDALGVVGFASLVEKYIIYYGNKLRVNKLWE